MLKIIQYAAFIEEPLRHNEMNRYQRESSPSELALHSVEGTCLGFEVKLS